MIPNFFITKTWEIISNFFKGRSFRKRLERRIALNLYDYSKRCLYELEKDSQYIEKYGYYEDDSNFIDGFEGLGFQKWIEFPNFDKAADDPNVSNAVSEILIRLQEKYNQIKFREQEFYEILKYQHPGSTMKREKEFYDYKQHQTALFSWEVLKFSSKFLSEDSIDAKVTERLEHRYREALIAKEKNKNLI